MIGHTKPAPMTVPFNKPVLLPEHTEVVAGAIAKQKLAGNGEYSKKCEQILERDLGCPVRLTTSATHALEMIALLADIKPGDEVILPSFTFVSSANAFVLRGARIRFADNDQYGNLLPSEVERLMTKRTRAVMTVHYAGASADMEELLAICKRHNVPLFEDAAQAVGARYKGRPLGAIGALGALSFHDTKNVTSGEGGALVMGDRQHLERAEIIREKGTNRSKFLLGQVDKYTWVDQGSSYILSELNSAYLLPQLEQVEEINHRRGEICARYRAELGADFARHEIQILETPKWNTANYHMFAIVMPNNKMRNDFIAAMRAVGVTTPFHYIPLHTSPFGSTFYESGRPERLAGCERISECLVRLPLYYNMTEAEVGYVVERVREWVRGR